MMFNSLNTLSTLIRESSDKAQDYLQELSRVLRYTLQDNDSHSVTLAEEMDFVHAYLYLLKMRYEENLNFDIRISSDALQKKLPPMAVQMLVENALKHNISTKKSPLIVHISIGNEGITVRNNLQLRNYVASNGAGLKNLQRQYALYGTLVEILKDEKEFVVKLPFVCEDVNRLSTI